MSRELIVLTGSKFRSDARPRWLLWAGEISPHYFLVWGSLDDAVEEMIDWIADNAPGLLCDESVKEEYGRAIGEGKSEEDAMTIAEQDTTQGDGGHYILSYQWGITGSECPDRETILSVKAELARP